jgi:hypothetical protein
MRPTAMKNCARARPLHPLAPEFKTSLQCNWNKYYELKTASHKVAKTLSALEAVLSPHGIAP